MREIDFIKETLTEVSQYLMSRWETRSDLRVSRKSDDGEMVTDVDVEIQRQIAERLKRVFPRDFLVAEELHDSPFASLGEGRFWILDPLDGTHNFIRGMLPAFGVSLAFAVEGTAAAAGIVLPGLDSLFLAERGSGAFRNGQRIHVSNVHGIQHATIEVEFTRLSTRHRALLSSQKLLGQAGEIRSSGCAVCSLCCVATGDADAYIHSGLELWDYAAGMLIVTEAGVGYLGLAAGTFTFLMKRGTFWHPTGACMATFCA